MVIASVYLSGPPCNVSDPSLPSPTDWKVYAASTFLKSGLSVANPIELDLTGFVSNVDDISKMSSVKHSLSLIDRADSLLANLTQLTESVTMEMFYAHRQGKKVVVVGNEPFSPWVSFHSEARFTKLREALGYLIQQPIGLDTVTWSSQFEDRLKRRAEQYPPEGESDFEYYGGSIPVLIISPHATTYFHDGNFNPSESYTGALSVLMHKLTGAHALISSYCLAADPVYYLNSPFVSFLTQIVKNIDLKLVLILHGIEEWNNPNSVILNTWNNVSLRNKTEYLNLLISMLKIKNIGEIGYDSLDIVNKDKKTINHLLFDDLSIPTITIGVHKRFRLPTLQSNYYLTLQTALAQYLMLVAYQ